MMAVELTAAMAINQPTHDKARRIAPKIVKLRELL
jgi:hypothetical protein